MAEGIINALEMINIEQYKSLSCKPLVVLRQAQQNGKTSIFSMPIPFALSMSKGELGFAGQAHRAP
jgi:hypothetical protein